MRPILRFTQLSLVVAAMLFTMGAGDPGQRFEKLGHQLICSCSCNQVLLECNHVSCPDSPVMRNELQAGIDRGDSDNIVLQAFTQKYGPTILAAPTAVGFNRVAWIMPFAVLLLGMAGTALLVRKWRLRTVPMPAIPNNPGFKAIRERIRRETDL